MNDKFFSRVERLADEDIPAHRACLGALVLIFGSWAVVITAGFLLYWLVRGIW